MKRCPKNHDNPDNAKFCRICGYNFDNSFSSQLINYWNTFISFATRMFNSMINESKVRLASMRSSSGFTPDMFPSINLSPCSVAKVDFQCKKRVYLMVVLVVIFGILTTFEYETRSLLDLFDWPSGVSYYVYFGVLWLLFFIFLFMFFSFLRRLYKLFRYKMNADYIESSAFIHNLFRIAKNGKLGLFDKREKIVAMGSIYDNITKFDGNCILVEKSCKKGLYSIPLGRMIVPILFERIEPFKNYIVNCHTSTAIYHYDVNGNKMA